jgi:hypothetical protein
LLSFVFVCCFLSLFIYFQRERRRSLLRKIGLSPPLDDLFEEKSSSKSTRANGKRKIVTPEIKDHDAGSRKRRRSSNM